MDSFVGYTILCALGMGQLVLYFTGFGFPRDFVFVSCKERMVSSCCGFYRAGFASVHVRLSL